MTQLVLDAGAFVAFDKGDAGIRARLNAARRLGFELATTAPVVAQVWRDGRRQALLATLLSATRVDPPDEAAARRAGELLAKTKTRDVVDALIIGIARDGDSILTSDPDDLRVLLAAARIRATLITI